MTDNIDATCAKTAPFDTQPLVSVLVPSYNHEKYVVECLESIKNLSYPRLELVLSDDRSSDTTFELAERWVQQNASRFERAITVRQTENLGIVNNLQFLFDNSLGEYLAYIASDDLFVETSITDRLNLLLKDESIDAVIGNSQLISESGLVLQEKRIPDYVAEKLMLKKMMPCALVRYWEAVGPVMMLRRESGLKNGSLGRLPQDLKFEDRYIYIRLASQGKLGYVDVVVAKYRKVGHSMSRTPEFYRTAVSGVVESDKRNRHLLKGFERLFIDLNIADFKADLDKKNLLIFLVKKKSIKIASLVVWKLLDIQSSC